MTLDGLVKVAAGEVDCAHVAHLPRLQDLVADLLPHQFQALQEENELWGQKKSSWFVIHHVGKSILEVWD